MQTENNGVVAAEENNVATEVKVGSAEIHTPYHEALADLNQPEEALAPGAAVEGAEQRLDVQEQVTELPVLETEEAVLAPLVGESLETPVTGAVLEEVNQENNDAAAVVETPVVDLGHLEGGGVPAGEASEEVLEETQLAPTPVEPVAVSAILDCSFNDRDLQELQNASNEYSKHTGGNTTSLPAKKKKTFTIANSPVSVIKTVEGLEALKEFGFGEPFINSEEKRTIVFDIRTGLPIFDETFEGAWKEIEITGKLLAINVLESESKLVVISAVATNTNTFYQVVKEHVFFNFVQRGVFQNPQEVVVALLASNLIAGRRHYDASAEIMEGFWFELFKAVYSEQTIINLTLKSGTGAKVPARLYFDPANQEAGILSVGGVCFDYTLGDYPDRAIVEGTKAYMTEKKKAEDAAKERESNRGGRVVIKQKQERVRPSAIAQMKAEVAPVLGYGCLPPAKPIPVKKGLLPEGAAAAVVEEAQPVAE